MVLPWLYSIGDNIGLFPVVYADRLKYGTIQGQGDIFKMDVLIYLLVFIISGVHTQEEDIYVISEVVEKYIYGYPWHLPG